ncbi:MAG: metallophosphoesterase [Acetobacter sp.]|nr:metallophosphoesterase [Bacteroides sp.]MCM1341844.1 metallophosphoesterase [Acetobacter sp.]MCM1434010.1 metallophosphoesterase [Clostridiales bacterium]
MTKLTFIADTHHYSKSLGVSGRAYQLRSGSDQKCLAETGDIIDAAFEKIACSDTDAVMIAGDVTNDGEMVSHLEFREKLYRLKKSKKIYLITATHDWCCDENPRRFKDNDVSNDVEVMPSNKLPEFYKDFGVGDALSVYTTHIGTCSYVAQLSDNVRLLALNDDKNANNHAGFTEEHFEWIEEQIKKAYEDKCIIIGMEHHLLTPHISPLLTGGGTCVADRGYVASRLADAGLKYMFVGHSHIQNTTDFKSQNGNVIKEVNIGSLVGYPAPIVNVIVNDDMTLNYEVEYLDTFLINGRSVDAQDFLRIHAVSIIHRVLDAPCRQEFADRLTALQLNGEKFSVIFPLIKRILKNIKRDTVADVYRRLKHLGLAEYVDKDAFCAYQNKRLISIIDEIWLSALDGSRVKYEKDSDYYRLVMSVISIPCKIFKKNNDLKKLIFAFDNILTGGKYNNQADII